MFDCLREWCKLCCIVNYLKHHTKSTFALSPGKWSEARLKLQKESGPRKDLVAHSRELERGSRHPQGGIEGEGAVSRVRRSRVVFLMHLSFLIGYQPRTQQHTAFFMLGGPPGECFIFQSWKMQYIHKRLYCVPKKWCTTITTQNDVE